jgi:hypothetical protein
VQFWQNDFPRKNEMASALGENRPRKPTTGLGIPNSMFGRKISLFREHQGITGKSLKLLNESPFSGQQGIPGRRLKLLDELTPASAEMIGNFARFPVIFPVIRELGTRDRACRRRANADDRNARRLHHRTTGPRHGEA